MKGVTESMKKALFIVVIMALLVGASACSQKKYGNNGAFLIRMAEEKTYGEEKDFISFRGFEEPNGIAFVEDQIVVADTKKNCLFVFDSNGHYVKKIGETGKGPLQFFGPTGLYYEGQLLYIVDARNNRVQVLNNKFEYVLSYDLNPIDSEKSFKDIVVLPEGSIYVSSEYAAGYAAYVFRIDPRTKRQFQIGNNLIGSLAIKSDNKVLFVNSLEIERKSGSVTASSGNNYLYEIIDDRAVQVAGLPYKYTPQGILTHGNNIYMISFGFDTIDRFTLSGEYIETVYRFPKIDSVREYNCLAYNPSKDYFLVSIPTFSEVRYLKPQNVQ